MQNPPSKPCVNIAGRTVNAGAPPFVVAEVGVNHNGTLPAALSLIDAATEAGADAVKFQIFRTDELATGNAESASYQKNACGAARQSQMLRPLELPPDAFRAVRDHCDERSILFVATPFGPRALDELQSLDPAAVKIASTDLNNTPLTAAAAELKKPLIVSLGAATASEIDGAVASLIAGPAADRLVLLHCISCYPTPVEALNLRAIEQLATRFALPIGLSDHTTSTDTGGWAIGCGACVIEKHLTLDRDAPGPDHRASLNPPGFRSYVRAIRMAHRAMGTGQLGMCDLETDVRSASRRSIVAKVDINAGMAINRDMLTLKRPGTGISPGEIDKLIQKTANADIPRDTVFHWNMVR